MTVFTKQQLQLLQFVKQQHGTQVRKYTGEPYVNHVIEVAKTVSLYESDPYCIEIAFCHDLFEDTPCNFDALYKQMISIGYERDYSYDVCTCVKELTDVYTHQMYPYLNRKVRKQNEARRLSTISYRAQSVKYADIMDNAQSIMQHDKEFGKVYINEVNHILLSMTKGNTNLYNQCTKLLESISL